jgi:starch synthase (maltosyl-transferring)
VSASRREQEIHIPASSTNARRSARQQRSSMLEGPRLYNLFPPIVGSAALWEQHLPRIAQMGFNWVYLNPFHEQGASGSLYAIRNPYRLSSFARGEERLLDDDVLIRQFVKAAQARRLSVAMDLVINHTAEDSVLLETHPEWYLRTAGGKVVHPGAVDPNDSSKTTIWYDLATLDYVTPSSKAELIAYWSRYVLHHVQLGITGFRCDAAYQVPADVWAPILAAGREANPDISFFAETLGCTIEQIERLAAAGFDYFFNSAAWWDFHEPWLLAQYERSRHIASSIAFPESHDTDRLAARFDSPSSVERQLKFFYLFCVCFSTGVMMPIGFEYGFRKKLDVVTTRPGDWEKSDIDISAFIAAANAMKAEIGAFNVEGHQRQISTPQEPIVSLLRLTGSHELDSESCALTLINPDERAGHGVDLGGILARTGGLFADFHDVTPLASPVSMEADIECHLEPLEIRIFEGRKKVRGTLARATSRNLRSDRIGPRIVIERVEPRLDDGRFPVKRTVGDVLVVSADIFVDGHDLLKAVVRYKAAEDREWREAPMSFVDNDRWAGRIRLSRNTSYEYAVEAWRDTFGSWRADVLKKRAAGQSVLSDLREGLALIKQAGTVAVDVERDILETAAERGEKPSDDTDDLLDLLLSEEIASLVSRHASRDDIARSSPLPVIVDRTKAAFSAWYELFPRSFGIPESNTAFREVIKHLPYVRAMGFDVLYLPPIHPIGVTNRKGKNNALSATAGDPGSPYAIGGAEGGHTAIHSELGTLEDFVALIAAAHDEGLEVALDFAVQCSPDHPWIKEHPEWFQWRGDGTIKFAENPPKKYEDIVNVQFYGDAFPATWYALRDVVLFWIDAGVHIFRVDNPHTKPLPFWEWMIGDIRNRFPEVIFLAEAFTKPKMMMRLAKLGFTQSYTYFTWRNTKEELTSYLLELTQGEAKDYYRPNFFTNTPDINPHYLQTGGRAAFIVRATLAATLAGSFGIYSGFELCEAAALPDREEYLDSEKYELRRRDWNIEGNIRVYIAQLNRIRQENAAFRHFQGLSFYNADNDQVLVYAKMTPTKDNFVLMAVSLDPFQAQTAQFELPLWEFGLPDGGTLAVEDLLADESAGSKFLLTGKMQAITLNPVNRSCVMWRLSLPHAKP